LTSASAPVAGNVELVRGAAIAPLFVEIHEAVNQRLARQHLHLGIERGADGKAALVELLLRVIVVDVAAHLLGEIFRREDMGSGRALGDLERLFLGLLRVLRGDVAVLRHTIEHVIAPLERPLALAERMIVVRRLGQRGEVSGFRNGQLVHRLVEIEQRGGRHAVGAHAEIDFIEIKLEDALLREGALDLHRQQRFLDLAGERQLVGKQEVLGDLLGDGRGALRTAAAAVLLHVEQRRPRNAEKVDAAVLVEVLVLGGDEGVDDERRHRLDRNVEAPLARVFGEQRTVGGMDPRHHRGLVILQLRIVGQRFGIMPEQARRPRDRDHEHDGSRREQEADEAQQQSHQFKSPRPNTRDSRWPHWPGEKPSRAPVFPRMAPPHRDD